MCVTGKFCLNNSWAVMTWMSLKTCWLVSSASDRCGTFNSKVFRNSQLDAAIVSLLRCRTRFECPCIEIFFLRIKATVGWWVSFDDCAQAKRATRLGSRSVYPQSDVTATIAANASDGYQKHNLFDIFLKISFYCIETMCLFRRGYSIELLLPWPPAIPTASMLASDSRMTLS